MPREPPRYLQPTGNAKQRGERSRDGQGPRRRGGARRGERPSRERSSWDEEERWDGAQQGRRSMSAGARIRGGSGGLSDDEDDVDALLAEGERMQQQWVNSRAELLEEAKSLAEMQREIAAGHG